jgi:hypothetical protein
MTNKSPAAAAHQVPQPHRRGETPAVLRNLLPDMDDDDDDIDNNDTDSTSTATAAAQKQKKNNKATSARGRQIVGRTKKARKVAHTPGGAAFSRERAEFLDAQRKFFDDVDDEEIAVEQISADERRRRDDAARRAAMAQQTPNSGAKAAALVASPDSAMQPKRTLADRPDSSVGEEAAAAGGEFQLHRGSAKRARRTKLQEHYPVIENTRSDAELQELNYVEAASSSKKAARKSK